MPSSPPEPPAADANTGPANSTADTGATKTASTLVVVGGVFGSLLLFLWHLGAASLSYAKYGSIGWAILDFFFASIYYPYYALVLNTPTPQMLGGRRRKMW